MTRKDILKQIKAMTGLPIPDIELVWVETVTNLNPSEWSKAKMCAAIHIHRYQVARLQAEIKRLAAGNKRRHYPRSYEGGESGPAN